jgi:hypothetical protein
MSIKFQLEFKDYLKIMYKLQYKRAGLLIFLAIALLSTSIIFSYLQFNYLTDIDIVFIIAILGLLILYPIFTYFLSKKNFNSHRILHEKIEYIFSDQKMKTIGESFNSEIDLNHMYKVVEIKDWFLIYHNIQSANLLPKKVMEPNEIKQLRSTLNSLKGVKIKLLTN